jgi:hypothetical protein
LSEANPWFVIISQRFWWSGLRRAHRSGQTPLRKRRTSASHELETIGESALPALRQATKSPDLETSRRATELVRLLEERVVTAKILAPKRLRLQLKDVPVLDAVEQLEKESGYKIQVQGKPDDRKITLDTGETTFWQALDQLCVRAELVEVAATMTMPQPGGMPGMRMQPAFPGGILPVVPPAGKGQKAPVLQVPAAAQAQPGQAQFPRRMPFPPGFGGSGVPMMTQGVIILTPGKALPPTCYAGSVRIRVVSRTPSRPGETGFSLDVAAEPRLQGFGLDGNPRVDTAIDDRGQKLELVSERKPQAGAPANMPRIPPAMWMAQAQAINTMVRPRQADVRFKRGEKDAKSLKELKGVLPARAITASEPLITVDNVLAAAGKTVKGAHGGLIQVQGIDKTSNGDYQVKLRLENPPGPGAPMMMMAGAGQMQFQQIQIQIAGAQIGGNVGGNVVMSGTFPGADRMPGLFDKGGKAYRLVSTPSMRMDFNNGQMSQEATLVFRPGDGQGPPARLVYSGQRTVNFQVPFRFEKLPLP